MEKPVRLAKPTEGHRGLEICEEGIAALAAIKTPIQVITCVGTQRTGKSTILNLLHSRQTAGFGLGHYMDAMTQGLWIWIREHPRNPGMHIVLMDTEGLDTPHITQHYNWILSAVALLISSVFLYQSKGSVESSAIDRLGSMLAVADQLRGKATKDSSSSSSSASSSSERPAFIWLIRDHQLQMKSSPKEEIFGKMDEKMRGAMERCFSSQDCWMLPRPVENDEMLRHVEEMQFAQLTEKFKEDYVLFERSILQLCSTPHTFGGQTVTGESAAALLERYCSAIKAESKSGFIRDLAQLPTQRQMIVKMAGERAIKAAIAAYVNETSPVRERLPVSLEEIMEVHSKGLKVAFDVFATALGDFGSEGESFRSQLVSRLVGVQVEVAAIERVENARVVAKDGDTDTTTTTATAMASDSVFSFHQDDDLTTVSEWADLAQLSVPSLEEDEKSNKPSLMLSESAAIGPQGQLGMLWKQNCIKSRERCNSAFQQALGTLHSRWPQQQQQQQEQDESKNDHGASSPNTVHLNGHSDFSSNLSPSDAHSDHVNNSSNHLHRKKSHTFCSVEDFDVAVGEMERSLLAREKTDLGPEIASFLKHHMQQQAIRSERGALSLHLQSLERLRIADEIAKSAHQTRQEAIAAVAEETSKRILLEQSLQALLVRVEQLETQANQRHLDSEAALASAVQSLSETIADNQEQVKEQLLEHSARIEMVDQQARDRIAADVAALSSRMEDVAEKTCRQAIQSAREELSQTESNLRNEFELKINSIEHRITESQQASRTEMKQQIEKLEANVKANSSIESERVVAVCKKAVGESHKELQGEISHIHQDVTERMQQTIVDISERCRQLFTLVEEKMEATVQAELDGRGYSAGNAANNNNNNSVDESVIQDLKLQVEQSVISLRREVEGKTAENIASISEKIRSDLSSSRDEWRKDLKSLRTQISSAVGTRLVDSSSEQSHLPPGATVLALFHRMQEVSTTVSETKDSLQAFWQIVTELASKTARLEETVVLATGGGELKRK